MGCERDLSDGVVQPTLFRERDLQIAGRTKATEWTTAPVKEGGGRQNEAFVRLLYRLSGMSVVSTRQVVDRSLHIHTTIFAAGRWVRRIQVVRAEVPFKPLGSNSLAGLLARRPSAVPNGGQDFASLHLAARTRRALIAMSYLLSAFGRSSSGLS